jgi:transcriptional regulator with XRE-family HTH domain
VLRAGFARAYYAGVESGERNVALTNLIRIAAALRVELGALFPPLNVLTEGEVSAEPLPETPRGVQVPRLGSAQTLPQSDKGSHKVASSGDSGELPDTVDAPGQFQWEPFPPLPSSQGGEGTEPVEETEAQRAGLRGRLISTGTAAEILGIDQRTVQRWLTDKALPVAEYVDERMAVFFRDDIIRVAQTLKAQAEREEAELWRGSQEGEHEPPR